MASTVSHPLPSAQAHAIADLTGYEDAATLRLHKLGQHILAISGEIRRPGLEGG